MEYFDDIIVVLMYVVLHFMFQLNFSLVFSICNPFWENVLKRADRFYL